MRQLVAPQSGSRRLERRRLCRGRSSMYFVRGPSTPTLVHGYSLVGPVGPRGCCTLYARGTSVSCAVADQGIALLYNTRVNLSFRRNGRPGHSPGRCRLVYLRAIYARGKSRLVPWVLLMLTLVRHEYVASSAMSYYCNTRT